MYGKIITGVGERTPQEVVEYIARTTKAVDQLLVNNLDARLVGLNKALDAERVHTKTLDANNTTLIKEMESIRDKLVLAEAELASKKFQLAGPK